jgi:hypothetical protein
MSPDSVSCHDDKAAGKIMIKGSIKARDTRDNKPSSTCIDGNILFNLTIDLKLNKSRITFNDFVHKGMNVACDITSEPSFSYGDLNKPQPNDPDYDSIVSNLKLDFSQMIVSIEKSLKSNPKKDNW